MSEMLSNLALERGPAYSPEPAEEDVWSAQKLAGFVEIGDRREHGVDLKLLWHELGNLVLLGAHTDSGEHVVTLIDSADAHDSLHHPSRYFSIEATDRIFRQAA